MDYISYSQYKTYTSCPRSWYLSKIRKAEEKQTWYIPVGSAVHDMIEAKIRHDRKPGFVINTSPEIKAEDYFYPLIERQLTIEPDTSKWLAGGPVERPVIEERALQLVRDCFEKALEELEQIDVWEVEYEATGSLPSLSVPVKAYVDIIGEHKKSKRPVILDWKSGSTKPDNFQLITYAALLDTDKRKPAGGFDGRYVMLAPGKPKTRYVDLSGVKPAEVGKKYQEVYDQMQKKLYQTNAGFNCRFCFHQENCLVNAGVTPRTTYYDRSAEDGLPF